MEKTEIRTALDGRIALKGYDFPERPEVFAWLEVRCPYADEAGVHLSKEDARALRDALAKALGEEVGIVAPCQVCGPNAPKLGALRP